MKTLSLDLETFSELDIKKVGAYRYAETCEILLFAYAFDDEPVEIVDLACGENLPFKVVNALFSAKVLKTAYNAVFEMQILGNYFNKKMDPAQWSCTMVLGLAAGLPAGLDRVGKILGLPEDKWKLFDGKRLINFFSKPYKGGRNFPKNSPEKWARFKEYCKQDVVAERAIRKLLAKYPLLPAEKNLWCLDQKINNRGVLIDTDLVSGAIEIDDKIKSAAREESKKLTGGINPNSNSQILDWIEEQEGWRPENFDKATREELLTENLTSQVKNFLAVKELLSKTSVKKYVAMRETVCHDGRVHGMLQYYGANRSGRWTGKMIQLQNLPQNHLDDLDLARCFVKNRDYDALEMFYENPSVVLSQLIRTAFVAEEGYRFIVADFSAIEARIVAWLADEKWRMKVFADGGDIYCASASAMFKVPVEKHGVNKELRQKGKIAELACGYGGGVNALKAFGADKMGLSDSDMATIIKQWRKANPNICNLWREVESSAKTVVRKKIKTSVKNLSFEFADDVLSIELPSKRKLFYLRPEIENDSLIYEGTIQMTGGWGKIYTWGGKLVENIVQAIARDCLAVAMLRLDAAGYKIVMHVHDEVILETPNQTGSLADVISIMTAPIDWATGLILNADGYETNYYKKD